MGTVQNVFPYGSPGSVTRSVDDIIIAVRNASDNAIAFGTPVFMTEHGAVPFDIANPQNFETFLGFAVRVDDKTPNAYPTGQFNSQDAAGETGSWAPGDVMEVLVRGSIALVTNQAGIKGGKLYIRKSDGKLTTSAGTSGTTMLLENVRIRNPRNDWTSTCEAIVNKRNLL